MAVISAVGRKLPRSKPKVWSRWIHWQSDTSLLRPGTFLGLSGFPKDNWLMQ